MDNKEYKYMLIEKLNIENKKRKTNIYSVKTKKAKFIIGCIKWHPSWRQYCFFPGQDTVFSKGCLEDINNFLEQLKQERKNKNNES